MYKVDYKMWTSVIFCLLIWGIEPLTSQTPSPGNGDGMSCPDGWDLYEKVRTCFKAIPFVYSNWQDARMVCQREDKDADLVTVEDNDKNEFFNEWLKKQSLSYRRTWIGLRRIETTKTFGWLDHQTPATFTKWGHNEPDDYKVNKGENCVHLYPQNEEIVWNDVRCSLRYSVVCEKKANNTRSPTQYCPDTMPRDQYLTVFQDKCYYFYLRLEKEFPDAQEICQQDGGNLASIKTQEVNDFIWKQLQEYGDNSNRDVWIGLSDEDDEGQFEWRDGTKMEFNNFEAGERSFPDLPFGEYSQLLEDCVMLKSSDGKWSDTACPDGFGNGNELPFVCEYPMPLRRTTTSSTTTLSTTTPLDTTTTSSTTTTLSKTTTTSTASTTTATPTTETIITSPKDTSTSTTEPGTTMETSTTDRKNDHSTNDTDVAFPKETATTTPTCPSITCNLDCGLDGYGRDSNGCMTCECNS